MAGFQAKIFEANKEMYSEFLLKTEPNPDLRAEAHERAEADCEFRDDFVDRAIPSPKARWAAKIHWDSQRKLQRLLYQADDPNPPLDYPDSDAPISDGEDEPYKAGSPVPSLTPEEEDDDDLIRQESAKPSLHSEAAEDDTDEVDFTDLTPTVSPAPVRRQSFKNTRCLPDRPLSVKIPKTAIKKKRASAPCIQPPAPIKAKLVIAKPPSKLAAFVNTNYSVGTVNVRTANVAKEFADITEFLTPLLKLEFDSQKILGSLYLPTTT